MGLVIAVVILAVLTAAGVTVYIKVRRLSESLLGTPDVTEGINRIRENVSTTPKSVSGMTRLMEPQIKRDFPEFVWEQFKRMSERVLVSALCAITTEDIYKLDREASDEVRQQVLVRIDSNEAAGFTEHFDEIGVHQTEISNYVKRDGRCVISIQSAVEYFYYKTASGKLISGDKEYKKQTRYNMELVYIQDIDMLDNAGIGSAVGTTCPNCGAPVRSLGAKKCEYCGSYVEPVNIKVWKLQSFHEVDYNHI